MRKHPIGLTAVATAFAMSATLAGGASASADTGGASTPAPPRAGGYYTGTYTPSLDMYSFNDNLNAYDLGRKGASPIDLLSAIQWAASAGFKAVDVTAYYIPGYQNYTMPSLPTAQIMAYADQIKALCQQLDLKITGTGVLDDFANPDPVARALDVQRVEFWTDVAAEMGATDIRVFSGTVPPDLTAAGGWAAVTQSRIVPALQQVTAYAATKGVKVALQNHGDMTATAAQTIQIDKWVDNPNLELMDDTGYFEPFQATSALGYDWYSDIAAVEPYSGTIQLKLKPAGEGTDVPMDFTRFFTDLRLSDYRGYIPLERLWAKTDPDNPKLQPTPPYGEISAFLAQVNAAMAATSTEPFDALRQAMAQYTASGDLQAPARDQLYFMVSEADNHFRAGQQADAETRMADFQTSLTAAAAAGQISTVAEQALSAQMNELQLSFNDVFGSS